MGFSYRKRIRTGKNSWINISKRGISSSGRIGPFTINSRGRTSVRLGKGLSYRGGCATVFVVGCGAIAVTATLLARL